MQQTPTCGSTGTSLLVEAVWRVRFATDATTRTGRWASSHRKPSISKFPMSEDTFLVIYLTSSVFLSLFLYELHYNVFFFFFLLLLLLSHHCLFSTPSSYVYYLHSVINSVLGRRITPSTCPPAATSMSCK